ncbi:DNA polymerase thumb domain-containing protein [Candidatus Xianfuyuplasma coldseepsis]|uniref:Damage repair protein n=1 Tax=Candidatus Xianfuyuplasma coldseepsis TaxID=2782163 RepID=A0A7L7KV51_9MOLU|nr:damage repair protein [Xianfuyuplasma coldseepsis]QMS85874.1 damage repair protein [Xianfuyuplasma coldseepsis]
MDQYRLYRNILCIDLKSFYASVECALRGLNPFTTPLVVADKSRSTGSVVLAVTPFLKRRGVKSRCRVFELPDDPRIIFAKPRMNKYLEVSTKIIEIYLKYVSFEDIHIYSVDEVFLDLTTYLTYYQKSDEEMAAIILKDIMDTTQIPATCGIGPNMLLSKIALDIESKKSPTFIAKWSYDDVPTKLWPISPLSEMWGIGRNMERNLNRLGLYSIGDIAHYPLEKLQRYFGIMGEELYHHAHGIDMSIINEKLVYKPVSKSVGHGQTLYHDYSGEEVTQIILEMTDDVVKRLRHGNKKAYTVNLGISYSRDTGGGGFNRQITLPFPTVNEAEVYNSCMMLFDEFYDGVSPIRKVTVRLSNLVEEYYIQLNLFKDMNQVIKDHKLHSSLDNIQFRYGKSAVLRASSLTENSTVKERTKMVGGHNA